MVRLQNAYDWLVLGDHPGALLTGSLVARMGYSVLMLPLPAPAQSFSLRVSKLGQPLDSEPNFLIGLGRFDRSNGLLSEGLSDLGTSVHDLGLICEGDDVFPEVVTPRARLNFGVANDTLSRALERELGRAWAKGGSLVPALEAIGPSVFTTLRRFPASCVSPPSRYARFSPRSERSDLERSLQELVRGGVRSLRTGAWLSAASEEAETYSELFEGLEHAIRGVGPRKRVSKDEVLSDVLLAVTLGRSAAAFKGGVSEFRKFLLGLARQLGAHAPHELTCKQVFVESGRLRGVQVSNQGQVIPVRSGVLGATLDHCRRSFYGSGQRGQVDALRRSPVPAGWRFTLSFVLQPEAVPPGVGRRVLWQEKGAPPLEAEFADPQDYGVGERGTRLLFLRTVLPFTNSSLDPAALHLTALRMFRQVSEIFPFIESHVLRAYPEFREFSPAQAEQIADVYSFKSVDEIPENIRVQESAGTGVSSGIQGLYAVSGESYPRLGSLGPVAASIEAVSSFLRTERGKTGSRGGVGSLGAEGSPASAERGFWFFSDAR